MMLVGHMEGVRYQGNALTTFLPKLRTGYPSTFLEGKDELVTSFRDRSRRTKCHGLQL
jgi:hypothetical protein